jgi:gliding motility-associated lipoprotein GldH
MLQNRNLFLFSLAFLFIFLVSCDSKRFFEENKSLENGVWMSTNFPSFTVNIADTLARYDLYLNVRNDGVYPYSNLYLFIHTTLPGGKTATDTVECQLADPDGKWRGSGPGNLKFNRFLFQKGMAFPRKGDYRLALEQAMRVKELKGIRDVGIRIEKQAR